MFDIGNAQIVGARENQEDYLASIEIGGGYLLIVADGMGGYEGGEVASKLVTKSFIEYFKHNFNTTTMGTLLTEASNYANEQLENEKDKTPSLEEMGCTLVATFVRDNRLEWVSIGDSILYKFNPQSGLTRLNADHSVAGELQKEVENGTLSQVEADAKPNRHALTSALTGYEIPHIEQAQIQINEGDKIIITSDGIHTINNDEISTICTSVDSSQALSDRLVQSVEKKSLPNQDNTTVIVLQKTIKKVQKIKNNQNSSNTMIFLFIIMILIGVITVLVYLNYKEEIIKYTTTFVQGNDANISTEFNSTQELDKNTSQVKEPHAPSK